MDNKKYISYDEGKKMLSVSDYEGDLSTLPDNLFLDYPLLTGLRVAVKNVTALPASFDTLQHLETLQIEYSKVKELPASISRMTKLQKLVLNNGNMDVNKELLKVKDLPALHTLQLNSWRGNTFPENIGLLQTITRLELNEEKKNAGKIPDIMQLVKTIPALKELSLRLKPEDANALLTAENISILDRLDKLEGYWAHRWNYQGDGAPLVIGTTRHVKMDGYFKDVLRNFRELTANPSYTPLQLQLLFGLHIKNMAGINTLLPNQLAAAIAQQKKVTLRLLDKPKGESMKSVNEKLAKYGVQADNKTEDESMIVVIGGKTTLEEMIPFVEKNAAFITTDHLNQVLIDTNDHWLLQDDNQSVNQQLIQLLSSNETENYKIAFEIIETGGANKTIQSALAAIMLAHPIKEVHKQADKLYDKYGSNSYRLYLKNAKPSLRVGGNIAWKLNIAVNHDDIDGIIFRLMYQCIAGANDRISKVKTDSFSMKGIPNITLPQEVVHFTQIKNWDFENCESFNIGAAIAILQEMPNCKELNLNGCHIEIPASITNLKQLQVLKIAHNTLADEQSLSTLHQLQALDATGLKLKNWNWLGTLKQLVTLSLNNNQLAAIPPAVFDMHHLIRLEIRQNKLTAIPEQLGSLPKLSYLDFSNNLLTSFPYFLAKHTLTSLLLRSNKLTAIDPAKLHAVNNGEVIKWGECNLSRNELQQLAFQPGKIKFQVLDISYNQLTQLDDSLFMEGLRELYANNNEITAIPAAASTIARYDYCWMQHNRLTELPAHFAHVVVSNCDFSHNRISSIHPDFEKYGADGYLRLYWKMKNNPLPGGKFGGMYL